MKQYSTAAEALNDMHDRGFTNDFQLFENDLMWVQQKTFIPKRLFGVMEYHQFWNPAAQDMDLVLIGIVAPTYNVQGILFIDTQCIRTAALPLSLTK